MVRLRASFYDSLKNKIVISHQFSESKLSQFENVYNFLIPERKTAVEDYILDCSLIFSAWLSFLPPL